jgi:hypothetical protein
VREEHLSGTAKDRFWVGAVDGVIEELEPAHLRAQRRRLIRL